MKPYIIVIIFFGIMGCSSSKPSVNSNLTTNSNFIYKFGVPINKIQVPINYEFLSDVAGDTLTPYSENYSEIISGSKGYKIEYAKALDLMIRDYLDKQFIRIDTNSTTTLSIQLKSLEIQEYNHIIVSDTKSSKNGITTGAKSEVLVSVLEGNFPFLTDTTDNESTVSNVKSTFKDSHFISINDINELLVIKLMGIVKSYDWGGINFSESKLEGNDYDIPVLSYSAKGNLESYEPVEGCAKISDIQNKNTPADILPSAKNCINEEKYDRLLQLSLLARVYAFFDMKRVSDGSAHQAILMLEEETFYSLSEDQFKKIQEASIPYENDSSEEITNLCSAIIELGPPEYHPVYMIQHGLGAFTNSGGNGLVENFDPEKAWSEVLTQFNCTE